MITTITKAYIRTYSDTGDQRAYVEWLDENAQTGSTEGDDTSPHMVALLQRAKREGVQILVERW